MLLCACRRFVVSLHAFCSAEGKRVALAAWRALQGGHRGGPELALADACLLCLDAKLQGIAAAQDASQVFMEMPDRQDLSIQMLRSFRRMCNCILMVSVE